LAYSYQLARQYDAALTDARQRLESAPDNADLHWILSETYRCKGMHKENVQELEKFLSLHGEGASATRVRRDYERGGYRAVVRGQINDLNRMPSSTYVSPVELALLYAQLGDRERTMALLEQGFREHSPLLLWIQCDPAYDFLHADGRYRSIIRRIGLPPAY
jgi:hypothetical protein